MTGLAQMPATKYLVFWLGDTKWGWDVGQCSSNEQMFSQTEPSFILPRKVHFSPIVCRT